MSKATNILKFWRDIEIFNLPDLPNDLKILRQGTKFPWEIPLKPLPNATRRYTLFLGALSKQDVVTLIEDLTGDKKEKGDWIQPVRGKTYMAVLVVDEDGRLLSDGAYLQTSYLQGIRCLSLGTSLSTVNQLLEKAQDDFKERHEHWLSLDEEAQAPAITWADLKKEIAVLNSSRFKKITCSNTIYYKVARVSKKAKNGDIAFLNSFYLDDLNHLISKFENTGKGLQYYLKADAEEKRRVDVLRNAKAFFERIDPRHMPAGRWPSDPQNGAYSAQLGAINDCLGLLKDSGIIGVNGPPGTGKTTLLNDIIADVTVQRAKRLIAANNLNLFMPGNVLHPDKNAPKHFPAKPAVFEDIGIVVASNNNAAVENISKELPDKKKVSKAFPHADYFAEFSQDLIENESWGVLAAALGNSDNRNAFKKNFWRSWGTTGGFGPYLDKLANDRKSEDQLKSFREAFELTRTELNQLLGEFEVFRTQASKFHAQLPAVLKDTRNKIEIESNIQQLQHEGEELYTLIDKEKTNLDLLNASVYQIRENIKLHQMASPFLFFVQKLFHTKKFKAWNEPMQFYIAELAHLSREVSTFTRSILALEQELKENRTSYRKLDDELKLILKRLRTYEKFKETLQREYEISYENIPDQQLFEAFHDDKARFHKCTPWSSVKINTLRSNIYLKSLDLQKLAILCNARQFKSNVDLLFDMLEGKAEVSGPIALSLWRTFFFCVPVVSTALASVSRLFKFLEAGSIGWLLLDEAGQATPQSAAGIINRAKRSIIIGDPLQNEPVVTAPEKLIEVINRAYKTERIWSPLVSSAQELADRVTHSGTLLESGGKDAIWTGFPLRTHRRCNDPMFSIANSTAYNNQMVKGLDDVEFDCNLGASAWFDVKGRKVANKHAIVEEILMLQEKLNQLEEDHQDVFVISPFKSVADQCRSDLEQNFPFVKFGTIHTFQGKEADIVFLVMGSDPEKPAARAWASRKRIC